jgi:hypothetical protein
MSKDAEVLAIKALVIVVAALVQLRSGRAL